MIRAPRHAHRHRPVAGSGQATPRTLAEVGATRLTRRPAAAAQAGLFALLGMVLVAQVVVVPLIAAAIAGVSIRRHPTVTRRLT